ncbi:unnamed protein product, partial [marine sediment metagenome]
AGSSSIISYADNNPILTVSGNFCRIEKIRVEGNDVGFAQVGIALSGSIQSTVTGCWIEDCGAIGIDVRGSLNCIITENICHSNGWDGIMVFGSNRCIVTENISSSNGREGIHITSVSTLVAHNQCYQNTENGIEISGFGDYNSLTGNYCQLNTGWGISISNVGSAWNIVTSNYFLTNTAGGFNDGGTNTQVGHNVTQ